MPKPALTSLIVSTYNAPQQLELVLRSALSQTTLPDEILVSDDGSTGETRQLIEHLTASSPIPIHHIWQEDTGFRKSHILNKTIAQAKGDYLIQIDGDCILHPKLVADHLRFACTGHYLFGNRVRIPQKHVPDVLQNMQYRFSLNSPYPKKTIRLFRAPYFTLLQRPILTGVKKFRGCNVSFWRSDILSINGYNEAITDWGCEDSELIIRLQNLGNRGLRLRNCALVYHLDHPIASRARTAENRRIEQKAIADKLTACELGINQYLT